jgi:quercetin dioxygenase-like cupin family protein
MTARIYPDWRERIVFAHDGPKPQLLLDTKQFKVVLVGLHSDQKIPVHPGPAAAYHVLDGTGWMIVGDKRIALAAGMTVVVDAGDPRGVEAQTPLAFIGSRGADE